MAAGGKGGLCLGVWHCKTVEGPRGWGAGRRGGATNPLAPSGNEVIAVDWKGLKDVDQINMDSTSSLHGSSLHRPSTEVSPPTPGAHRTSERPQGQSRPTAHPFILCLNAKHSFRLTLLQNVSPTFFKIQAKRSARKSSFLMLISGKASLLQAILEVPRREEGGYPHSWTCLGYPRPFLSPHSKPEPISPGMASM